MKGSCLDLEAAYKQLAVREDHKKYAVVGLPRKGKTVYYVLNALAFGASADVLHFNRAARALNHLCHEAAGCAVTNFFDDFVCIAPACVIDKMYERCKRIINLMGWKLKEKSIIKPDYEFVALGVRIRFCDDARTIKVLNKKDRIDKLRTQIEEIQTTKMLPTSTVQRLRGKMVFSNSQVNGRVGAVAPNLLGKHHGGRIRKDLDMALGWWIEAVGDRAKPRTITVRDTRPPILIFTDRAHEEEVTGYGGLMIDPHTCEVSRLWQKRVQETQGTFVVERQEETDHRPS